MDLPPDRLCHRQGADRGAGPGFLRQPHLGGHAHGRAGGDRLCCRPRAGDGHADARRAGRRRRGAGRHRGQRRAARPVLRQIDGPAHARTAARARALLRPVQGRWPRGGHGVVLQALPRLRLHQGGPHRQEHALFRGHRGREAGDHHQPLQAGEGPARHRRAAQRQTDRLSQVHALPGEPRLRGPHRLPRAAEPPHDPADAQRQALAHAVFPLPLLRRALHRTQRRTRAHAHLPRRLCAHV